MKHFQVYLGMARCMRVSDTVMYVLGKPDSHQYMLTIESIGGASRGVLGVTMGFTVVFIVGFIIWFIRGLL